MKSWTDPFRFLGLTPLDFPPPDLPGAKGFRDDSIPFSKDSLKKAIASCLLKKIGKRKIPGGGNKDKLVDEFVDFAFDGTDFEVENYYFITYRCAKPRKRIEFSLSANLELRVPGQPPIGYRKLIDLDRSACDGSTIMNVCGCDCD